MIISASRRTDIPAFFAEWLEKRIREGYVCTRNPFRYHQVSKVLLTPDRVDAMVFWSKNPRPLLERLDCLNPYMYYFQYTLNAYGPEIEPNLPPLGERVETFWRLADKIGDRRVVWRYDPIFISPSYPLAWHIRQFETLVGLLKGKTDTCVISFIDPYPSIRRGMERHGIRVLSEAEKREIGRGFSQIAQGSKIRIVTCCEDIDLSLYGIGRSSCIDKKRLESLLGCRLTGGRDKGQRNTCGCMESVDIGGYRTCRHGCVYCYAGGDGRAVATDDGEWMESPILGGTLADGDVIREKKQISLRDDQIRLFP